jgi:hypothetical protein
MSCTIDRRGFIKCALASAMIIPALSPADARAADLPLLDPSDSVAQSLGFASDATKVAANANRADSWRRLHSLRNRCALGGSVGGNSEGDCGGKTSDELMHVIYLRRQSTVRQCCRALHWNTDGQGAPAAPRILRPHATYPAPRFSA